MYCPPPAEKAMATHSNTLAWKIPWTEEPGGLQSMGSLGVGHDWATSLSLFTFMHWRRKWQPTPVFLPGESQGQGSLGGLLSMGSHRVGHDWSNLAAAKAALFQCSYLTSASPLRGFPRDSVVKESTCQCKRWKRLRFDPWVGKISWRRKWRPTAIVFPGKFHGQRRLSSGLSKWSSD